MIGPGGEKDLLIALAALQLGLLDRAALFSTVRARPDDRTWSLADELVRRGHLDPSDRRSIERLAEKRLARRGHDATDLGPLTTDEELLRELSGGRDPGLTTTLPREDPTATEFAPRSGGSAPPAVAPGSPRFRVLRPHAQGGLGAVFLALDAELNREVALKQILDLHADDPESRQRFRVEAEVTGGLEHPGIVPVYGMGTYPDGRPYYAMRFIQGESLRQAIEGFHALAPERRPLELRRLLRRFLDVCNAIHYAHSRGVLHRDIKPSNIILGKYGETLVVDWGLAKATGKAEAQAGERTLVPAAASGSSETQPGSAMGTPAYMSAEQALGDLNRLGPRSDVYSLGATLYHLLLGRPPLEGDDVRLLLQAAIRGEIPALAQADPTIDPALAAIVKQAMALEPEGRYATARELADDLERWMADEPVTAHRDGLPQRLGRWSRHHAATVAGIGALLSTAVVALSLSTWLISQKNDRIERARADLEVGNLRIAKQRDRANRASEEAERQARRAELGSTMAREAVKQMLDDVARSDLLGVPQAEPLRVGLAERALAFYREFDRLNADDPGVKLELARIEEEVASLYRMIGKHDLAAREYATAVEVLHKLIARQPDEPKHRELLAHTESQIGEMLRQQGRPTSEAEPHYREAVRLAAGLRERHPGNARYESLAARTHNDLADMLANEERLEEAEPLARLAVAAARAHRGTLPSRPDPKKFEMHWTILPLILSTHGDVLGRLRRDGEAQQVQEDQVRVLRDLLESYPENNDLQWLRANAQKGLAQVLAHDAARRPEALALLDQVEAQVVDLVRRFPSTEFYAQYLVSLRIDRGSLRLDAGLLDPASSDLGEAERRLAERLEKDRDAVAAMQQLGEVKAQLARLAAGRGDRARARALAAEAVALDERVLARTATNPAALRALERHRAVGRDLATSH